jgi:hypothetical protein
MPSVWSLMMDTKRGFTAGFIYMNSPQKISLVVVVNPLADKMGQP